ncbi:chemotaxis protein CheD [Shewanella decolorationis]|uniref:Probable chemoreceptor glutamine deamidase CheD n=2 Tax=Shewanella decolorationis TaxID=256839 RepID=A0A5B8QY34_9GAMM|nr:chemotaxis protein CheD [Shewanella decolorationis]ESE43333.1 chemotaxis protein [Shewanella decolorationis S12]QDZ90886.1 chemotaxis protein CheD [Shewanella decolorationis]GLR31517.1 putative chemoreceptor glutamine deamidase CheD 2 [Shewanella decolorationis]
MGRIEFNQRNVIMIGPGQHYATAKNEVIKTLLGSCVAVCLFDPKAEVIGMNHFLLAADRRKVTQFLDSRAGYYGVHAMEILINAMLKLGAQRQYLQSKIFGGANVLSLCADNILNHYDIGGMNIDFVRQFLKREQIPIVSEDLGGHSGRIIYFDPTDFSVYRSLIENKYEEIVSLQDEEYRYFNQASEDIHSAGVPVVIWQDTE